MTQGPDTPDRPGARADAPPATDAGSPPAGSTDDATRPLGDADSGAEAGDGSPDATRPFAESDADATGPLDGADAGAPSAGAVSDLAGAVSDLAGAVSDLAGVPQEGQPLGAADAGAAPAGSSGPGGDAPPPGGGASGPPTGGPPPWGGAPGAPTGAGAPPWGDYPPPPGVVPPGGQPPPPGGPRRLQRSRRNRVLAGVAGGLGEYAGIDPLVFRVLFAVLTLFGGAGLLLYLVCWLLLPDEGQEFSPAETLVGRGRGGSVAEAALLAACALLLGALLVRGDATDVALLAIVVVGLLLILRNVDTRRRAPGPWAAPPYPGPPYPSPPGPGGQAGPGGPTGPAPGWPVAPSLSDPLSTGTATTATLSPYQYGFPPPPRPRPRPAPSILGLVALSVALVALGVLGILRWTGAAHPSARHYLALALATLGVALLVGAWFGRARWLIAIGVPLALALVGVSTIQDAARGGVGDQHIRVASATDLGTRYETGVGRMQLDLSTVDFTDRHLTTNVHIGLGDVVVVVPRNVDLVINVHDGLGTLKLLGHHSNGIGQNRRVTDSGPDGVGGGNLELIVDVGVGDVEVDRAPS